MWTILIAVATFLLLKHPLARITTMFERYSWASWPLVWTVSIAQSLGWYLSYGYASSGALCYYAKHAGPSVGDVDARDLVQFIPRAFAFLVVIVLYSQLFSFLRRPDTIQLSSHFAPGSAGKQQAESGMKRINLILPRFSLRSGTGKDDTKVGGTDSSAPWEQMEFVQVGHGKRGVTTGPFGGGSFSPSQSMQNPTSSTPGILLSSPTVSITNHRPGIDPDHPHHSNERGVSISSSGSGSASALGTAAPTEASSRYLATPSEEDPYSGFKINTPSSSGSPGSNLALLSQEIGRKSSLSPIMSDDDPHGEIDEDLKIHLSANGSTPGEQTLKEFFQENQITTMDRNNVAERGGPASGGWGAPMSAAAYFNRQASLLMLYFPLAYLAVFSMSLVRLVYDMVNHSTSPVLSLLSAWMVLAIGLIDALVYGLAEFIVRRRVRRKMGDR